MEPLSPRARDALAAYRREHSLSPGQHERLLEELAARLAPAAPSEPPAPASPVVAGRGALHAVAMASFGALLAAGVAVLLFSERPQSSPSTNEAERAGKAVRVVPSVSRAEPAGPAAVVADAPDEVIPPAAVLPTRKLARRPQIRNKQRRQPAVTVRVEAEPSPEATARESVAALGAVEARSSATPDAVQSAHIHELQPHRETLDEPREFSAAPNGTSVSEVSTKARRTPPPQGTLDEEVLSLRRAHELTNRGEALRALSALDEHARRFPRGKLLETAQVARLSVLCELGRLDAARAQATQFLRSYPSSLYAARVRRICTAQR